MPCAKNPQNLVPGARIARRVYTTLVYLWPLSDEVRRRMSQPSKRRIAPVKKDGKKRGGLLQALSISLPTLRKAQRRNAPCAEENSGTVRPVAVRKAPESLLGIKNFRLTSSKKSRAYSFATRI